MSNQDSNFSRRERLGRRVLAGVAVILMGASLVFTWSASAHNINLAKAKEVAREYARGVRIESNGKYINSTSTCGRAFANHNHYVRCTIDYQNAKDKAAGVYTCRESIEVYMLAHYRDGGIAYTLFTRHTSVNRCGNRTLYNDTPVP